MTLVAVAETLFPGESRVGGDSVLGRGTTKYRPILRQSTNRQSQPD